ncbi:MAG: Crp/Fnr family transcriptional regulator [Lachnospiraceae bacterium]|nr:Crp/Fnr family transcriptional regulator [Lachnospiraceae bacterium]
MMDTGYHILYETGLFGGIDEDDLQTMLTCLHTREAQYRKGELIFQEGDVIQEAGIVLSGRVHVVQDDFWGNRHIVSIVPEGNMFGEAYACLGNEKLRADVRAEADCRILFLNLQKAMHVCKNTCPFHQKLVKNILYCIAGKNLNLAAKIQHTSRRSIREKVLSYLSEESRKNGSSYFTVPFTRQQMADFLAVDRSALSKELSRMQQDGLIEFERNQFHLKLGK